MPCLYSQPPADIKWGLAEEDCVLSSCFSSPFKGPCDLSLFLFSPLTGSFAVSKMRDQENNISWGPCLCDAWGKETCHRKGSKAREGFEKWGNKGVRERQFGLTGMKKDYNLKCSLCQGDLPKTPFNQVSIVNKVE